MPAQIPEVSICFLFAAPSRGSSGRQLLHANDSRSAFEISKQLKPNLDRYDDRVKSLTKKLRSAGPSGPVSSNHSNIKTPASFSQDVSMEDDPARSLSKLQDLVASEVAPMREKHIDALIEKMTTLQENAASKDREMQEKAAEIRLRLERSEQTLVQREKEHSRLTNQIEDLQKERDWFEKSSGVFILLFFSECGCVWLVDQLVASDVQHEDEMMIE